MKNLILATLCVALLGLLFVSCERNITEPEISSNPTKPTLADLSFTGQFAVGYADSLIGFSWSAADFGFSSSITYALEMSPKSDFSGDVSTLFTTQKLSGTVKVSDLNNLILSWNNEIGKAATVYYRISASVGPSVAAVSAAKSRSFTPYESLIDYPMIYVPGAYQGWSPGAANGRLYSYGFNSQYAGIVRLVDGTNPTVEFKITSVPSWSGTNWGGTLTQSGTSYSGTLDPTGGNFKVNAGTYALAVNVSAMTITLTKTDDWGIIGSAVPPYDWSRDVDLFYNGQRRMWEITAEFRAGEIKFRANDDWALNYGDNNTDGTLEAGGANIPLASAGNYTIRMDVQKLTYTVKKN